MEANLQAAQDYTLKVILTTIVQIFFAEFFGTALFMYIGCSGCIVGMGGLTFAIGTSVGTMVVGNISEAHMNPAVTIGAVIMGEIKLIFVPIYFLAQFTGALFGYTLVFVTIFMSVESFLPENAGVVLVEHISLVQALFVEVITTMIVVITYCSFWHSRELGQSSSAIRATVLGTGLMGLYIGFKPLTGACMNSARALPPAIFSRNWNNHWIYWVGPNVGAVIGATYYRYILMTGPLTNKK